MREANPFMTRLLPKCFAERMACNMDLPSQIEQRLKALGIAPAEVVERFVRGSGPGGQKINKTSSTVLLRHAPTGTEVRCQKERSQAANREWAWQDLCEKLEARRQAEVAEARSARERVRRQNRKKSRAQKARMVAGKRHRSDLKSRRGRVSE